MSAERAGSARPAADRGRLQSLAPIAVFDVVGPLVAYYWLRSAGLSTVAALILSGALPAFGIALGFARHRRLDAIGIVVLSGIVIGSAVGLASGSARLILLDGIVPTAVFGAVCVGSLWTKRPLIYRFALEAIGAETPRGRNFADRWRYASFRHAFRVTTAVWGVAFLAEAAVQGIIIQTTSTATAKTTSNLMPPLVLALLAVWNISYAKQRRREGELARQAARARGEAPPPMPN
jgi:intracellular septation protein A